MNKKNKGTSFQYVALALVIVAVLGISSFAGAAVKTNFSPVLHGGSTTGSSTSINVSYSEGSGSSFSLGAGPLGFGGSSGVSYSMSDDEYFAKYPILEGQAKLSKSLLTHKCMLTLGWATYSKASGYEVKISGKGINGTFTTTVPRLEKTYSSLSKIGNQTYTGSS